MPRDSDATGDNRAPVAPPRVAAAYDEVPYTTLAVPFTHPNRLATLATLFGMGPASVEHCRVLELGCSDGTNLISMAAGLPGSQFVGLDAAARRVAEGQIVIKTLGLENVTLQHRDLMDCPADLGQFDYIIAHGVYSWVPATVRDRLLAICRAHLAPHGVAYVSYNAFPGCHLRQMAREMMLYHTRSLTDVDQRVTEAQRLMDLLATGVPASHPYQTWLRTEWQGLRRRPRSSVFHDDLAGIFVPVYFWQFMEHAGQHSLQFLAEADLFENPEPPFPPPVVKHLDDLARAGRTVEREQFVDFLTCRQFRSTLLCREEVSLERTPLPERVTPFRVAVRPLTPAPPKPESAGAPRTAPARNEPPMLSQLLAQAALQHLEGIAPRSIPFQELMEAVRSQRGIAAWPDECAAALAEFVWEACRSGLFELRVREPEFVMDPGEHPLASPLARFQAQTGEMVTNQFHENVRLEVAAFRRLLTLLDGTRDHAALAQEWAKIVHSHPRAPSSPSPGTAAPPTPPELGQVMAALGRFALLLH